MQRLFHSPDTNRRVNHMDQSELSAIVIFVQVIKARCNASQNSGGLIDVLRYAFFFGAAYFVELAISGDIDKTRAAVASIRVIHVLTHSSYLPY